MIAEQSISESMRVEFRFKNSKSLRIFQGSFPGWDHCHEQEDCGLDLLLVLKEMVYSISTLPTSTPDLSFHSCSVSWCTVGGVTLLMVYINRDMRIMVNFLAICTINSIHVLHQSLRFGLDPVDR